MQQLKDKLAIAERAAKAEAQSKDKFQLRFKVLEERLKAGPSGIVHASSQGRSMSNVRSQRQSLGGAENLSRTSSVESFSRKDNFYGLSRTSNATSLLKQAENLSSSFDGESRLTICGKMLPDTNEKDNGMTCCGETQNNGVITHLENSDDGVLTKNLKTKNEDYVSGMLYDMLQNKGHNASKSLP